MLFGPSQLNIYHLCCETCFFLGQYAFTSDSRGLLFIVLRLILIPSSARLFEILLRVVLLSFKANFFYLAVQSWDRFLFPPTFSNSSIFREWPIYNFFLMELTLWVDTPNFGAISFCFMLECSSKTLI